MGSGIKIKLTDNSADALKAFEAAVSTALEECGKQGASYATNSAPVDTGWLKTRITYSVRDNSVAIGTNVEYAIYQELGTGKYAQGGRPTPWVYRDAKGNWHWTAGNRANPFIKPAVADHVNDYKAIIESSLKKG